MPDKTTIHGFSITYEDTSRPGVEYLRNDLSYPEARVFFDQARMRGSAEFEDDEDRQYTLLYQGGAYTLLKR